MPEWTTTKDPAPATAPKPLASWYAQGLSDGLGDRLLMFDNSSAPSLELLRFRPDLGDTPGFEAALREQVRRLDGFRHPSFARVRAVQRLDPDDDLALISNCTPGKRLSEVLHRARGATFAAAVIEQLGPALVRFQQHDTGVTHGALSPERIIVSPDGQFTIVEHVVGPAINVIGLEPSRLRGLGIPLPASGGQSAPRLDVATDWYQLGLVAMSALLGRQVTAADLPQLERLLDGTSHDHGRDGNVLSPWIRQWLERALQISNPGIETATEARAAIDEVLDRQHHGAPRRIQGAREAPVDSNGAGIADVTPSRGEPAREVTAAPLPAAIIDTTPSEVTRIEVGSVEAAVAAVPPAPVLSPPIAPTIPMPVASAPEVAAASISASATPALTDFRPEVDLGATSFRPAEKPRPIPPQPRPAPSKQQPSAANPPRQAAAPRAPRVAQQPRVQAQTAAPAAPVRIVQRTGYSTAVVAALMLLVLVQAGVIALMARALWFATPPPIAVKADASGGNVLVSSKPTQSTPLRLSAAPDLSWISVTSPSATGLVGAKASTVRTGSIKIASPINLAVLENSRQIGSVPGQDVKVKPGKHEIELVNAALGYRLKQSIEIQAGETVSLHVAPAQGWATIYAVPTAEVSIDGRPVGRTPLGPLALTLGEHTVTFTHPTGATDRQRIKVNSGETVRVIGNPRR